MAQAGQKFDLEQMQNYFEQEAVNIRFISDYQLSESDYKSLGVKLKALFMLESTDDWLEEFILPITIYSTYSYIYAEPGKEYELSFTDIRDRLSQYQLRRHLQNMQECLHDHGFLDFGYGKYDLQTSCRMSLARHAGIPNDEKYAVFELLSEFSGMKDMDEYMEDLVEKLPPKTKKVFAILDQETKREMIHHIRDLMATCRDGRNRDKILEQYPHLSISMVDYCIFWSENKQMQRKMHL